jgi:ABC-type dipeptide/oligopeptide/nickel transport system permease component
VIWTNLGVALLNLSLLVGISAMLFPRASPWARVVALAAIKLGGVVLVTALLVHLANQALLSSTFALGPGTDGLAPLPDVNLPRISDVQLSGTALAATVASATFRSLLLVLVAVIWGVVVGLGAAYFVQLRRSNGALIAVIAVLAWVTPTFLLAAFAQEVQAQIFNFTDLRISGGYGTPSALQAFWAGIVLGIRPAAYAYRQARVALESERVADHVRTARANGLPWRAIVNRHIVRPAAASLVSTWLNSFRLMLGSLPIVEFFFGYPGLGQQLVLSLGVAYPDQVGEFQPDAAIAFVVSLAVIVLTCEAGAQLARLRLDVRLADVSTVTA